MWPGDGGGGGGGVEGSDSTCADWQDVTTESLNQPCLFSAWSSPNGATTSATARTTATSCSAPP